MNDIQQVDFCFQGEEVGYFMDPKRLPVVPGLFDFMPYRGPGHYELVTELKKSGPQECEFSVEGASYTFTVVATTSRSVEVSAVRKLIDAGDPPPNARS